MLWLPTESMVVWQTVVRVSPLPVKSTAEHPEIDVPASVKLTLPVGAVPITVAVNVTTVPSDDGLSELASAVRVAPVSTMTCDNVLLDEAKLLASPP